MHKRELIKKLESFASDPISLPEYTIQRIFAAFLVYYLKNLSASNDEKYDFWNIVPYLPELMVEAFEQLRAGRDEQVVQFRKAYEKEAGYEVPNIIDLGTSEIPHQVSALQTVLGPVLKTVTESSLIEHQIETYCNAQRHVLRQTFNKFLRRVYRRGLSEMVEKCSKRTMSGKFGETELRTLFTTRRVAFIFTRSIGKKRGNYRAIDENSTRDGHSVSFVGEDGDPLCCLSAGIRSVRTDFRTALDLIEDVIKYWPHDTRAQKRQYKSSIETVFA